ncbi:MAG TPA: hypothetical protein VMQ93_15785 [Novosphingobium sp.]|nr:hypothetical protein [Novosphingobium sp.]
MITILIVHAIGLFTTGVADSIQTTAGPSISGGGIGLFLGGIISIPWLVAIAIIVHFYGGLIERHPIAFAIIGPVIVSGTYALSAGVFWQEAAISSVVSTVCYIPFAFWQRQRLTALD